MSFPDSFSTDRLRAERLTAEHFDALCDMDRDPQFMGQLGGPRDAAQTNAYLARNLQHWDDYGFGLWILRLAGDGRIAGRGVLRHLEVEGTDEVELGYGFHPEFWGRGLATEIATTFLHFGRETLRLPSVVAITRHANLGSQRVLVKAGLTYERDVTHDGVVLMLYRSLAARA
jgi:RimJ/RimL family protein N-acetyltransferase